MPSLIQLADRTRRDNTIWHVAQFNCEDGTSIRVGARRYTKTGPVQWRIDGARCSLQTIRAAIKGADIELLRGNRAKARP